jgi:hypothetical protein
MTLEEFADKINALKQLPSWDYRKDMIVRVRLDNPSAGPLATTEVSSMYAGSDWDRNSFLICTGDKIYREK